MQNQDLLLRAQDPATTPFDYIVVGSGAGGGPLAAQLASKGRSVLVIEAGGDGALDPVSQDPKKLRPIYAAPGYHAAATEDPEMSWEFSVRHYASREQQQRDSKYFPDRDPANDGTTTQGAGGIFYPRCSSIGGCTAHHAMIIARPNDGDWDRLADLTGDESWQSQNMQGYFARLESCLYYKTYEQFLTQKLGRLYTGVRKIIAFFNPKWILDTEGHGFIGWQPTSLIDPFLVSKIAKSDRTFRRLLFSVIWARLGTKSERSILRRTLERFQIVQLLDPNARSAGLEQRARVALIPLATKDGWRSAVRERLLDALEKWPDLLVIHTHALATKILFRKELSAQGAPVATGVEVAEGTRLYRASVGASDIGSAPRKNYFARHEVILSGGSFNSPQLLMLSGIGDRKQLEKNGILGLTAADGSRVSDPVHLPGVGRNLQDRYEISVISEAKQVFTALDGLTFDPQAMGDPARIEWEKDHQGLYSTNGGAVAILAASNDRDPELEPDLFIFGFPAAFRGYYWNWSRELLRKRMSAPPPDQRNLWSWVILKAYTNNNGGTVELRSTSPADPPDINFHSFTESPDANTQVDLHALLSAIGAIRGLNKQIAVLGEEIQPGSDLSDADQLRSWVEAEAWGHHACGTCRIGSDPWRWDTALLVDQEAVLDSRFRVHGVEGLRVADASVFPRIPGYFIVAPTMMVGEKAADTILADSSAYPQALESLEEKAILERRKTARLPIDAGDRRPREVVGLALSGGGIRSAVFGLGFLQALAAKAKLRHVDFLSTVSGGGYIGCFLGRLFTRLSSEVADKVGRVEALLSDLNSPEIWWLRENANYISGEGRSEAAADASIIWRNLWSVHICLGAVAFAALGVLRAISDRTSWEGSLSTVSQSWHLSPWAWLVPAVISLAVAPAILAYWFNPLAGIVPGSVRTAIAWTTLAMGLTIILTQQVTAPFVAALLAVGLAWLWHEIACRKLPIHQMNPLKRANMITVASSLTGNRLTRALTMSQALLVGAIGWVVLDSLARAAAASKLPMVPVTSGLMVLMLGVAPLFRRPAKGMLADGSQKGRGATVQPTSYAATLKKLGLALLAFALAAGWLFAIDLFVHVTFNRDPHSALTIVAVTAAVSVAVGGAFTFVNRSSLQQVYAERLTRTFLGASSEARIRPSAGEVPVAVQNAHEDDDVSFWDYHPEKFGGPLHLVNVCVNQTVDLTGSRQLRADKGLSMCVGPKGVSVGRRFHSLWGDPEKKDPTKDDCKCKPAQLEPLPAGSDPSSFHVLGRTDRQPANVETLRLGQWMAISGAAYTTGDGRLTSLPLSWLLGMINLRIGYWWNSGIDAGDRPSRYPPVFWRRLLSLPAVIFRAQSTILQEWRARFLGPAERYWYLSDGGHFEGTGLYELLRRRVALMIAVDSSQDSSYLFDDLAEIVRIARLDFGAEFHWMDPTEARAKGSSGWAAFTQCAAPLGSIPNLVQAWSNPDALGTINTIRRDGRHVAALAAITYSDAPSAIGWVLYVKAVVPIGCPRDVRTYADEHADFPNQPTVNQFFTDEQWECYRAIGEQIGSSAIRG